MKKLRSHILRVGVILLVCSGLMIGFTKPANAVQSNEEFGNWLQSLTKQVDSPELQQKLRSLKSSKAGLYRLLQEASQIVSENNEDFNIPLQDASGDIHQILLVEWNQFQSGNAMAAVPSPETVKPTVAPHHQKPACTTFISSKPAVKYGQARFPAVFNIIPEPPSLFSATPMISGIAIGAP